MAQRTYGMIKPHAIKSKHVGDIINMIEQNGFTLVRLEKMKLTKEKAEQFYAIHKEKPFFAELVTNIIDGPIVAMVLEKDNAIEDWRALMGATDSKKASPGTIRQQFGVDISFNVVHGSDAPETAEQEIKLIFPDLG